MRPALLVLVVVCAAACLSLRAEASVPCRYGQPTASDVTGLNVAVRKVAGAQTSRLGIHDLCGTQAELQSLVAHRPQDVREWLTLHCQRNDAVDWQCDPLVTHLAIKVRATIGGKTRVIDTEFPPEMPVATASDLVLRATSVMEAATPPTLCDKSPSGPPFAEREWPAVHGEVLDSASKRPFDVTALIREDPATAMTLVYLGSLAIAFPSNCWIEVPRVVVTS